MSLITCEDCGNKVSSKATKCRMCGRPIEKPIIDIIYISIGKIACIFLFLFFCDVMKEYPLGIVFLLVWLRSK